jgi:ribonuclease R
LRDIRIVLKPADAEIGRIVAALGIRQSDGRSQSASGQGERESGAGGFERDDGLLPAGHDQLLGEKRLRRQAGGATINLKKAKARGKGSVAQKADKKMKIPLSRGTGAKPIKRKRNDRGETGNGFRFVKTASVGAPVERGENKELRFEKKSRKIRTSQNKANKTDARKRCPNEAPRGASGEAKRENEAKPATEPRRPAIDESRVLAPKSPRKPRSGAKKTFLTLQDGPARHAAGPRVFSAKESRARAPGVEGSPQPARPSNHTKKTEGLKLTENQKANAASAGASLEEKILDLIAKGPKPERLLRDKLRANDAEKGAQLKAALKGLLRAGKAVQHRGAWRPSEGLKFVEGSIVGRPAGAFLLSYIDGAGQKQEVLVPPKTARALLPGDLVQAALIEPREPGFPVEGCPTRVVSRPRPRLWARAVKDPESGALRWSAERRIEPQMFDAKEPIAEGEIALIEAQDHGFLGGNPRAKVIERLGNQADNGIESKLSERINEVAKGFSEASLREAKAASLPRIEDEPGRVDLRDAPICTIDGENSRDFDDGVAAFAQPDGSTRLLVAIADVSHYVREGSALDEDARRKMTSVYLPHGVEPMLPESLSNGLCSLNPGEDRLALCAEVLVSAGGEVISERFFKAMIRSHARLTYTQVSAFLDGRSGLPENAPASVAESLRACAAAQRAMLAGPLGQGRIDMGQNERETRLNANGKIEAIEPRERDSASRLVEEMMLAANRAAASALAASGAPGMFRNHFAPSQEALDELTVALGKHGVEFAASAQTVSSADFARLIERVKDHPHYAMIRSEILHRFESAAYSSECAGHFSLGMSAYTHFTSPIRRYPDLVVHRLLGRLAMGLAPDATREQMDLVAEQATVLGRKARDAEVEARKLLSLEYASRHVGELATARVDNLTERGVWALLEELGVEAFIPAKSVSGARFEESSGLWKKDDGSELLPGDTMPARLQSVAVNSRRIELSAGPLALTQEADESAAKAAPRKGMAR